MTTIATSSRAARRRAARAAKGVWMSRLGRAGLGARGLLYVLLAYLALQVAFGRSNGAADKQGALRAVARQPFGHIVLGALAVGFGAYALWQLGMAAFGGAARAGTASKGKRVIELATGVSYGLFCATTVALATGSSRGAGGAGGAGGDKTEIEMSGKVMQHSFGRAAVGLVGITVVVVGAVLVWRALSGKRDVKLRPMSGSVRRVIEGLAKVGLTARAVIIAAAGVFVLQAALAFNPNKAKGLDGILRSFTHTPVGPWLLVLIATGLLAFGAYSLAAARYADI